jgi:hypothetical protein
VREYQQALLRRSFRNAEGRPSKETLANLSMLPSEAVETPRKLLAGKTLVDAEEAFDIEHAVAHGHVAAAHVMASRLKFSELLGPRCRERDLAYALIVSRATAPQSTSDGGMTPASALISVSPMCTPTRCTRRWTGWSRDRTPSRRNSLAGT